MQDADIVDRIYEAAVVPSLWRDVLDRISKRTTGRGAFLFAVSDKYLGAIATDSMGDIYERFVAGGWSTIDPRFARVVARNYAGFLNDQGILSDKEIETDEVYRNFYRPNEIGYMAGTYIPSPTNDAVAFAFQRHQNDGPVSPDMLSVLDKLRPHLARASFASNRLGFEQATIQTDALQMLGIPCAALRDRGQVLAANSLFQSMMPSLFKDGKERLRITVAAADAIFETTLASITQPRNGKSIPIAAGDDRPPMVLHIIPIQGHAHDIFCRASMLAVVMPVDRAIVPAANVLQGLFDLTPREASIARGIAAALSVEEIAADLGTTYETVRTQLKSVFMKTGVARQQELVALLAGKAIPMTE